MKAGPPVRNLPPPPLPETAEAAASADRGEPAAAAPDFPRAEFGRLVRRLPAYARLAWALARDPRISRARRLAVLAGAAYVISPVDLVPGIIPLAGQLDDLLVALAAIRVALEGLKPELRAARLGSVGLSQADLDADMATVKQTLGWMVRTGVRGGQRLAAEAVTVGGRAAEVAGQLGGRAAEVAGQLAGRAAKAATGVADSSRHTRARISESVRQRLPRRPAPPR